MKAIYLFLCFFIIQACSDSQFEKRLADSFDSPLKSDFPDEKSDNSKPIPSTSTKEIREPDAQKSLKVKTKKQLKPSLRRSKKFIPQPYRIIIRLSGANPSAPAENVTTILRDAGVAFEVERIERLDGRPLLNNSSK